MNLESIMLLENRSVERAVDKYPGYGLAAVTAALARSLGQSVARDPLPEEPAHGVIYGPKGRGRSGISGKLRDDAEWVIIPANPVGS